LTKLEEVTMKVLLAEDDAVTRRLLCETLSAWGYDVLAVADGDVAWEILQQPDAPRVAILDWEMPGLNGVGVCRAVREAAREPYQYVILLTARAEVPDVVEGLDAGADDYLSKPVAPPELRSRLGAGRRVLQLQDELIAAREALRLQATRDALTGLMNRGAIVEHLERELARSARQGEPLGVLLADLDHFKHVNDAYGHLTGDEVLREAGRRLRGALRAYDEVGRYGGEEFLVVLSLSRSNLPTLQRIGERLRLAVGELPFDTLIGKLSVSASLGLAVSDETGRMDSAALLQAADKALYRAKHAGRNCLVIAGHEHDPAATGEEDFYAARTPLRSVRPLRP
jgi:two-component system, cell cycle response regulator